MSTNTCHHCGTTHNISRQIGDTCEDCRYLLAVERGGADSPWASDSENAAARKAAAAELAKRAKGMA